MILGDRVVVPNSKDPDVMAKVDRYVMLERGSVAAGLYEWKIVIFTFCEGKVHACPTRWEGHLKNEWS